MIRKIIEIDATRCNGCGLCASACHEGAIAIVDGKARLLRDDYCDGLGNCLPACPTGAITFIAREAAAYDEEAVKLHVAQRQSRLAQWPIQIKLAAANAPYFADADLLVAADCCAYARNSFHNDFMRDKITLIGCPKLDDVDYSKKLGEIIGANPVKSVTVARMEVPCCSGIEKAAVTACENSGKTLALRTIILSTKGETVATPMSYAEKGLRPACPCSA